MEKVFITFLNMGLTATWIVLAVLAVRALCHKAPKALTVCLWALVGLRLVCPVLVESILSLIPSGAIISPDILLAERPSIYTGVSMLNSTINPLISEHLSPGYSISGAPTPGASANPMQIVAFIASVIWIAGICCFIFLIASSGSIPKTDCSGPVIPTSVIYAVPFGKICSSAV